jgi:hypothetical protein
MERHILHSKHSYYSTGQYFQMIHQQVLRAGLTEITHPPPVHKSPLIFHNITDINPPYPITTVDMRLCWFIIVTHYKAETPKIQIQKTIPNLRKFQINFRPAPGRQR